MFQRLLKQMQEKIRTSQYIVSEHADERMDDDGLAIYDVECAILSAEIQERQRDRETKEWKYRLRGASADGGPVEVIAKISPRGKLAVVTVYRL